MYSHHCGCWCPGAKSSDHQYPQCWLNIWLYVNSFTKKYYIYSEQHKQINYDLSSLQCQDHACCWSGNTRSQVISSKYIDLIILENSAPKRLAHSLSILTSSPPRQNGLHFADDIFRCIVVNENFRILITISLKFVPKFPNDKNRALVQKTSAKPLSKPMLTQFTDTYMCH